MVVSAGRADSGSKKRVRTGVAISPSELCAADIRLRGSADRAWRAKLEPPPADGGSWSSLASALNDLARAIGVTGGTLAISLMPPLTEVRRLDLPPLRDEELQRLLSRNASRYFVNARSAQIVGAAPAARRARGAPVPVVAAAASARLVATIRAAAAQSGWTVESVAPAEGAWAAAALALWPAFAKQNASALIAHDDRTDLLQLEQGKLIGVRRFRAAGADAAMIADTVGPTARVGIAGSAVSRRELAAALSGHGVTVASPPSGEWTASADSPDVLAAHFAGSEIGPVLRTEDAAAVERERARKAAWLTAAAAAGLLVLSAGVELWGVHRELALVRAERGRIRPQIASTLIGRTTVDATSQHLAALDSIERASPHWSSVITTLSEAITDDAYLTAIRARKDSIIVDGLAEHASRVFDALQQTRILTELRSPAPVRREPQDDGSSLDHFTIAGRLAIPATPSKTAAAAASTPPKAVP